jgi:DNA-binding NarL/FixJ family response regulator
MFLILVAVSGTVTLAASAVAVGLATSEMRDDLSTLAAAGAGPRTTALSGVESLTPSEHRVAALAAGGYSDRDIAQELFVTPKAVEVHLSSAYRKLGIAASRELPRFF